jgi:hypothetical protein
MNDENLIFVSASNFGSYYDPDEDAYIWGLSVQEASTLAASLGEPVPVIKTDFVGINSNIYEPITASANTLGYPALKITTSGSSFSINYVNRAFVPGYVGVRGLPHYNESTDPGRAAILNAIILHRQGPYGWPTWKQVRVGNHPINRAHRKNNIFSYAEKSSTNLTPYELAGAQPSSSPLTQELVAFNLTESCISSKNKPLQHSFVVKQDGKFVNLNLKHSYGNLKEHYTNNKINIRLKFNGDFQDKFTPVYDDLKQIYIDKDFVFDLEQQTDVEREENPYGMATPFKKWVNMTYTEGVFPKQQNAFLAKTRQRTQYDEASGSAAINSVEYETFWKDDLDVRNSLRTFGTFVNAFGITGSSSRKSVWPLDTGPWNSTLNEGELAARTYDGTRGMTSLPPMLYFPYGNFSAYQFPKPLYYTDVLSGKKPFYNSYADFAEDIRGLGKSYSILPEFRISDHMEYYVSEKEGNFRANNPSFLSLNGATITSSAGTLGSFNGLNNDFFIEYSNSDFLKYFQKLAHDHQDTGEVSTYTFTMKGIKKLLPYKGFYPILRAQELGTLFSQSFGRQEYISGSSLDFMSLGYEPNLQRMNALSQPFLAPGITFNSIKSALAVDFPIFVNSAVTASLGVGNPGPGYITNAPTYRMPFEAVIEPQKYIPKTPKKDFFPIGKYPQKKIFWSNSYFDFELPHVVWFGDHDNLYSLAANNFYGEIPKFFLKNQRLTDFISKPQAEWKEVQVGKTYYLDVVIKRSDDMVLSEGQAFSSSSPWIQPPNRGGLYGPGYSSSYAHEAYDFPGRDPAYAAYTPPYFYENSIVRIAYTPATSGTPTVDSILSSIQSELETPTTAPQNGLIFTGSFEGLDRTDNVSTNKMVVTSSVNIFGKSRFKKVTYDTNVGPDGNYIPTTIEDTDAFAFTAWSIGTKFECPALNFSASTDYHSPGGSGIKGPHSARGIFGGYGTLPSGSTGLYLQVKESYPDLINAGDPLTGSLIDVCGFESTAKKIGKPAAKKVISEAIVAIPFTYEKHKVGNATTLNYPNTLRKFFRIPVGTYKQALKQSQQGVDPENAVIGASESSCASIVEMINKMQRYNIPPQFDFSTFTDFKPFVMYIFEFEHSLNQQDLTDIWQGLMPDISRRAQTDEVIVSHKAGPYEFFGGKKLPENTRWMLFKVKRKAEKSYFATTSDSTDDSRFKFQFGNEEKEPEYSYNWPYDFFSLVELTKMEVDIEFTPKKKAFEE